jgi:hypothetical protein
MTCDDYHPHAIYDPTETFIPATHQRTDETDPRCQLKKLESEITRLKALLDELEHERAPLLKKEINRRFPPILRLPHELSAQIFTTAFPENSRNTWRSATPLVLGKVCSTWRRIAWSTPRLWNTISLRRPQYSSVHIELLGEWLERSGQCLLYIHITYPGFHNGLTQVKTTPLWQIVHLLSSFSKRWGKLDLDFSDFILFEKFCSISGPHDLPLLSSLSIKLGRTMDPHHFIQPFRQAPELLSLRLSGAASLKSLILPIHRLTRVWLGYTPLDECLDLLRDNPQLVHCTFDCIERGSNTQNLSHVSTNQLESLDLYLGDRRAASDLFDYLTIPSLNELAIHTYVFQFRTSSFISFIERSGCVLQRLSLSSATISEKEFVDCMRVIPSLVELDLQYMTVTSGQRAEGTSRALNVDISGDLLPNLRKLSCTTQFIYLPGWLDMLLSRWNPLQPSQLRFVALLSATRDIPDATTLAGFRKLVAEGMDITLATHDRRWL